MDKLQLKEDLVKIKRKYGCMYPGCKNEIPADIDVLHFHHVEPEKKYKNVSAMFNENLEAIIEEINKCVVLCPICHAVVHQTNYCFPKESYCYVNLLDFSDNDYYPIKRIRQTKKEKEFTKSWNYTYADISKITGININTLRQNAKRGKFDPADLLSVIRFCAMIDYTRLVEGSK